MRGKVEVSDMDIVWLAAGAAFFLATGGLLVFIESLRTED